MVGDPEQIRAAAARLRADADRVRQLAARVGMTRDTRWRSAAAAAFRERVGERVHSLRRAAQGLDEAAGLVESHARGVAQARAEAARVAAMGAELARESASGATRVARREGAADGGTGR